MAMVSRVMGSRKAQNLGNARYRLPIAFCLGSLPMTCFLWVDNASATVPARQRQIEALSAVLTVEVECFDPSEGATVPTTPAAQAERIVQRIARGGVVAVFAPQSPHWLRVLSICAVACHAPFYGGLMTSGLPRCMRTISAGRLVETIATPTVPFFATVPLGDAPMPSQTWPIAGTLAGDAAIQAPQLRQFTAFIRDTVSLDGARVVFAGGMGLGSKAGFDRLALCAQKLGVGLGASRLAVDLGWCRNDMQVGQTGRCVAPDLYVAFGISGAIQHLAGMQNSRRIFAVNTDPHAPIFEYADAGFVGNARDVIEGLLA